MEKWAWGEHVLLFGINGMWLTTLEGFSHLQGDRIHCCPHSHSLSVPHTCRRWGWSPGYTHNPPHRRPHSQVVRQHPDTSLDTNSHTKSKSCWEDRTGLHGETEAKQTKGGQEGKKNGLKKGSRRGVGQREELKKKMSRGIKTGWINWMLGCR